LKINFLALNDNLGHQELAVKLMQAKNWINPARAAGILRALEEIEDFNNTMISENNGIEIIDTEAIDTKRKVQSANNIFNDVAEEFRS
jgi:hypothetical protein